MLRKLLSVLLLTHKFQPPSRVHLITLPLQAVCISLFRGVIAPLIKLVMLTPGLFRHSCLPPRSRWRSALLQRYIMTIVNIQLGLV